LIILLLFFIFIYIKWLGLGLRKQLRFLLLLFKIIYIINYFCLFLKRLLINIFFVLFKRKFRFEWKKSSRLVDSSVILKLFLINESFQYFLVQWGIPLLFLLIGNSLFFYGIVFSANSSRNYWIKLIHYFLLSIILLFIL
jgi:hypothetical protein